MGCPQLGAIYWRLFFAQPSLRFAAALTWGTAAENQDRSFSTIAAMAALSALVTLVDGAANDRKAPFL